MIAKVPKQFLIVVHADHAFVFDSKPNTKVIGEVLIICGPTSQLFAVRDKALSRIGLLPLWAQMSEATNAGLRYMWQSIEFPCALASQRAKRGS